MRVQKHRRKKGEKENGLESGYGQAKIREILNFSWVACSENSFISLKKFFLSSCQNCPQFSARICGIAVGKCVEVFTEMFKAVEVWILHNSIKMCISVITESEKKYKASLRKGVGELRTAHPLWVHLLGTKWGVHADTLFLLGLFWVDLLSLTPYHLESQIIYERTNMTLSSCSFQRK